MEIDAILANVTDMGGDLALQFAQDMQQDIAKMNAQLGDISKDLKFLRGRSVEQLFDMRKKNVFK